MRFIGQHDASDRWRDPEMSAFYNGDAMVGLRFFRLQFGNQVLYSMKANGILILVF